MFREIQPELNRQRNPSNAEHELRTTKAKATMLTEKIEDKESKSEHAHRTRVPKCMCGRAADVSWGWSDNTCKELTPAFRIDVFLPISIKAKSTAKLG
jgi:hypothetical protein